MDRRKRKALKRLLESRETNPKAKEALQGLLWNCELAIKNHEKFIEQSARFIEHSARKDGRTRRARRDVF